MVVENSKYKQYDSRRENEFIEFKTKYTITLKLKSECICDLLLNVFNY